MYTLKIGLQLILLCFALLKGDLYSTELSSHRFLGTEIIENELVERDKNFNNALEKKLSEVILYITKNDLKAASAVLTLIKAKTVGKNPYVNYLDAYLDSRLNRADSAIRTLKKIDVKTGNLEVKKCFLWLKILWDEKRWQEVHSAMNQCQGVLAEQSKDELFYTKNLLNMYTTHLDVDSIVPSPFFYYFAPDYLKIEQWLSLLIMTNNELIALPHLKRIPEESLSKGNVRLLTATALWNTGDQENALSLMDKINDKNDWNFQRLAIATALANNNFQIAWDTNRELLLNREDLWSNQALQISLAWNMNLLELFKIKKELHKPLIQYDPAMVPLIAGVLFLKGQNSDASKIINQYVPKTQTSMEHQIAYWGVRQWISLRNNQLGTFMSDAEQSCQKKVSFGCWMILSGQDKITIDKSDLFPYDSVGDYFRENL